jgi:hypothetical protein
VGGDALSGKIGHALGHGVERGLAGAGRALAVVALLAALLHARELRFRERERERERERDGCAGRLVRWLGEREDERLELKYYSSFFYLMIFFFQLNSRDYKDVGPKCYTKCGRLPFTKMSLRH